MNKLTKIGVSALCGSLASVSAAQAGALSVTGGATATWVSNEGTANGNPIGLSSGIAFAGSGELDNGTTFSEHELTEKKTKIDIYFANPYHSWERGCNENFNGLLRQFFPKKSSFATVTQEQIEKVIKLINNRPRKRLNYRTPAEVFRQTS